MQATVTDSDFNNGGADPLSTSTSFTITIEEEEEAEEEACDPDVEDCDEEPEEECEEGKEDCEEAKESPTFEGGFVPPKIAEEEEPKELEMTFKGISFSGLASF